MVYIISYDIKPEENYDEVHEKIKELSQGHVQVLDSVWFIRANVQPQDIFLSLGTTNVSNNVVIVQVTKTGWLSCGKEKIAETVNKLFD